MPDMPIGITEEHEALRHRGPPLRRDADPARGDARGPRRASAETVPEFWPALCEPGWLGLHVDEANGGAGYGFVEQAVVLEELGHACAPGPYIPTVLAAAVLQAAGGAAAEKLLLPGSRAGELTGAVALGAGGPMLGGTLADVIVVSESMARGTRSTRARFRCGSAERRPRRGGSRSSSSVMRSFRRIGGCATRRRTRRDLAAVLLAAEAVGIAQWCVDTAAEYAKVRVQFGRPIGQFQGVKHRCADMLARTELARAAVWDAARAAETDNGAGARDRVGRRTRVRRRVPERQGLRADPRWHRLHVGARRARLPPPGDDVARARGVARRRGASTPRARRCTAAAARSALDLPEEAETIAPSCAPS